MDPLESSVYENVALETTENGDNCVNFDEVCIHTFSVIYINCNA